MLSSTGVVLSMSAGQRGVRQGFRVSSVQQYLLQFPAWLQRFPLVVPMQCPENDARLELWCNCLALDKIQTGQNVMNSITHDAYLKQAEEGG